MISVVAKQYDNQNLEEASYLHHLLTNDLHSVVIYTPDILDTCLLPFWLCECCTQLLAEPLKLLFVAKSLKRCWWNAENSWRHVCSEYMQRCWYMHFDSDSIIIYSNCYILASYLAWSAVMWCHTQKVVYNSRNISPQITLFHEVGWLVKDRILGSPWKNPDILKTNKNPINWQKHEQWKKNLCFFWCVGNHRY